MDIEPLNHLFTSWKLFFTSATSAQIQLEIKISPADFQSKLSFSTPKPYLVDIKNIIFLPFILLMNFNVLGIYNQSSYAVILT